MRPDFGNGAIHTDERCGYSGEDPYAVSHVTGSTPSIQMLLRPEEKHGASRKRDVVPPLVSGHRKMNDSFPTGDVAVSNFHFNKMAYTDEIG